MIECRLQRSIQDPESLVAVVHLPAVPKRHQYVLVSGKWYEIKDVAYEAFTPDPEPKQAVVLLKVDSARLFDTW